MNMAEENPSRSVPGAVNASPGASPLGDTRPAGRASRSPKRRRNVLVVVVIVAVLLVGGVFLWRYFSSYESTDDAQADVHL